ncbi:22108_t:CDS:2, partial [Cetraspora pellucida]
MHMTPRFVIDFPMLLIESDAVIGRIKKFVYLKDFEKDPLASQIFRDNAPIIDDLCKNQKTKGLYKAFMKLVREIKHTLPLSVKNKSALKNLLFRLSSFISISKRESLASADRKGDSQMRRHPDIMFMVKHLDMLFEIIYVECLRLVCTPQK